MDSLPLFTIPKWIPKKPHPCALLPELWCIIFWWQWRLEMKDIHKELFLKMKDYRTLECGPPTRGWIPERRLAPPPSDSWIRTNYLWSKRGRWYGTEWGIEVRVIPKCGYKHLNRRRRWPHPKINGHVLYSN